MRAVWNAADVIATCVDEFSASSGARGETPTPTATRHRNLGLASHGSGLDRGIEQLDGMDDAGIDPE